jgi:cell division protein FtsL
MGAGGLMRFNLREKAEVYVKQHGRQLLGLFVLVLLVHNVFGAHGFVAMHRTQAEIEKVKGNIEKLNKENVELEQEVKDLKSDPRLIEKIAREEGLLARPGEVIIRIPAAQPGEPSTTSKP